HSRKLRYGLTSCLPPKMVSDQKNLHNAFKPSIALPATPSSAPSARREESRRSRRSGKDCPTNIRGSRRLKGQELLRGAPLQTAQSPACSRRIAMPALRQKLPGCHAAGRCHRVLRGSTHGVPPRALQVGNMSSPAARQAKPCTCRTPLPHSSPAHSTV